MDLVEGIPTYGGHHLEKLASYGDPSCISFPIPQIQSTNLSFVGLETFCRLQIYGKKEMGKPVFERNMRKDIRIKDLLDIAASAQFSAFFQISQRVHRTLHRIHQMSIPLTGVHLVGGVACNDYFREMLEVTCKKNKK